MRSRLRLGFWLLPLAVAACQDWCDGSDNNNRSNACIDASGADALVTFNIPEGTSRALVFAGTEAKVCVWDRVFAGGCNPLHLGSSGWDGVCTDRDLVAFAPAHRPARQSRETALPSQVDLGAPDTVPVRYWIVRPKDGPEEERVRALITAFVADANVAFDARAAGIVLDYGSTSVGVIGAPDTAAWIGKGCSRAWWVAGDPPPSAADSASASAEAPPSTELFDRRRLNVFFVDLVESYEMAIDCKGAPTGSRPEIIYVSYASERGMTAALFAHEVGHALGSSDWGHTDLLAGFEYPRGRGNLMYSSVQEITDLTLGQIYRINFDSDAWRAWQPQPLPTNSTPDGRQLPSCLGFSDKHWPCPVLALRPDKTWP